jgi:hypothetical protein
MRRGAWIPVRCGQVAHPRMATAPSRSRGGRRGSARRPSRAHDPAGPRTATGPGSAPLDPGHRIEASGMPVVGLGSALRRGTAIAAVSGVTLVGRGCRLELRAIRPCSYPQIRVRPFPRCRFTRDKSFGGSDLKGRSMVHKTSACWTWRSARRQAKLRIQAVLAAFLRRFRQELCTRCVYPICTSRHSSDWKARTSGFALYGGRRTTPPERCESSRPPPGEVRQ